MEEYLFVTDFKKNGFFRSSFNEKASKLGLNVNFVSSFDKDGKDFRSIISKSLNQNPSLIVCGGYGNALGVLVKQLREAGYTGPIYGTPELNYPKVLSVAGDNIGEAYAVDFDIDYSGPKVFNFVSKYRTQFGKEPSPDAFIGYDGIGLIVRGHAILMVG